METNEGIDHKVCTCEVVCHTPNLEFKIHNPNQLNIIKVELIYSPNDRPHDIANEHGYKIKSNSNSHSRT